MITLAKLALYRRCGGDVDLWARTRRRRTSEDITAADWQLIDELLQRIHVVKAGLASPEWEARTRDLIAQHVEDGEVAARLYAYA
jgi:hypothetical protein